MAVVDGVAHLCAYQNSVTEVLVAGDELVPQPALLTRAAHDQIEGTDLVEVSRGRERGWLGVGTDDDGPLAVNASPRRRQGNETVAVHCEHGDTHHHVLEVAVGLEPADAAAEPSGQGGTCGLGRGRDQGAKESHQ